MSSLTTTDGAAVYARLKTEVTAAGLLKSSPWFYFALILFAFSMYLLSGWAIVRWDSYLSLTVACLAFTFSGVQIAGLMHDAGHRAAFSSRRANDILGYSCCAMIGTVFQSWRSHHNAHHGHPNEPGLDPDMEFPFVATTSGLWEKKRGLERRLARYQAFYYYPLGAVVGITNRLGSAMYFLRQGRRANVGAILLYLPAIFANFLAPFLFFPLEKAVFVFLLVHLSSGVYLANCFAPNHKGMYCPTSDEHLSFFEQQVVTARNIKGSFFTDLILVGLNLQIEHHLFPSCPRNRLHKLVPLVQKACADAGVPYMEQGIVEANRFLVGRLSSVARGDERIATPSLAV